VEWVILVTGFGRELEQFARAGSDVWQGSGKRYRMRPGHLHGRGTSARIALGVQAPGTRRSDRGLMI